MTTALLVNGPGGPRAVDVAPGQREFLLPVFIQGAAELLDDDRAEEPLPVMKVIQCYRFEGSYDERLVPLYFYDHVEVQ